MTGDVLTRQRQWWRLDSLRTRLTVVAAVVFAVAGAVLLYITVAVLYNTLYAHAQTGADTVLDETTQALQQGEPLGQASWEPVLPMYYTAVSSDGETLEGAVHGPSRPAGWDGEGGGPIIRNIDPVESTPADLAGTDQTGRWIRVEDVVVVDGVTWTVIIRADLTKAANSVEIVTNLFLWALPILLVLFTVAIWLLLGGALSQVERVRISAAQMSGSTRGERLPEPSGADEMSRLTHTFNGLLDRIDEGRTRQAQFISDASHELRSPISTISNLCQVVEEYPKRYSAQELAERVGGSVDRLNALVGDLLDLARVREPSDRPLVEVDLDDLVHQSTDVVPDDIDLDVAAVEPLRMKTRPVKWKMIISNLVSNAARHADECVSVSLTRCNVGTVRLEVCNDGDTVAAGDRHQIFERFTRLDAGRARDAGGAGLGLAIVAEATAVLGGTCGCDSDEWGHTRFWVEVPCEPGLTS